jgi:hypothetical protein
VNASKLGGLDPSGFQRAATSGTAGFALLADNISCADHGGPSVTVQVGALGLVAVYADASMGSGLGATSASEQLWESPDLSGCETILQTTNPSAAVRRTLPGSQSGTTARGSWLIFSVTPGARTFTLREATVGLTFAGGGLPHVDQRGLWVMPLG